MNPQLCAVWRGRYAMHSTALHRGVVYLLVFLLVLLLALASRAADALECSAGIGRQDITPENPVHLGGYAARTEPFKTIGQRIFVKALALRDAEGTSTLIVTADTIGTPGWFNNELAERIQKELHVPRERFLFACSHSHSAPVISGALENCYNLSGEASKAVEEYTRSFLHKAFEAARQALDNLEPARLAFGRGEAIFAANRRQFGKGGVFIGINLNGVVDHDVPVLRVAKQDGTVKAVLFGYACHCTTLGATSEVSGDWAGYAQDSLERAYPGATALFVTGCGADANPYPRNANVFVNQHGLALAGAVARVLNGPLTPVDGPIRGAFAHTDLPLAPLPSREEFAARLTNSTPAVVRSGKYFLDMLDRGEQIPRSYPCPVQVLRFGDGLTLVALGGEVVADYAHRLRRELPKENLWAAGYCNDVFAYVPSVRLLIEGGYETDSSMIYYGLPTRFAPEIEEILVGKVLELNQSAAVKTTK